MFYQIEKQTKLKNCGKQKFLIGIELKYVNDFMYDFMGGKIWFLPVNQMSLIKVLETCTGYYQSKHRPSN